jgi:glycerol-3-phosphate dehydrogenase
MKRDFESASRKKYDLIIIGAGMFGACAAWEAAQRGLSVILLEMGDFSGATSANHLKMVHGGIRYLQHGDIYRVRESVFERSAFLRIAPHLVQPLPVVMPTYGHGMKGKEVLKIGMAIYDLITLDRNKGINDNLRKIPNCYSMSKEELLNEFPGVEKKGLTGAAVFTDAQMYNPPRLALSFIRSAVENGSAAFNYAKVNDIITRNGKVLGVKVADLIDGNEIEILGDYILNTSGAWSFNLLKQTLNIELKPKPAFSRDAAFVIKNQLNPNFALAVPLKTKDADAILDRGGRHVFIAPWLKRDKTLIGVWHIVWGESENRLYVKEEELKSFIKEVNEAYPSFNLSMNDVAFVNTGLTLFSESTPGSTRMSFGKRSKVIDHEREHQIKGLLSLIGVRATVARWDSKKVISYIADKLNKKIDSSKTHKQPIWGGEINDFEAFLSNSLVKNKYGLKEDVLRPLLHNYGSKYNDVLNFINESEKNNILLPGTNKLKAEIIHAVKNEMAEKLDDVLVRRTDLGTDGSPSEDVISNVAKIMADNLNWNSEKTDDEIERCNRLFDNYGSEKKYNFIKK